MGKGARARAIRRAAQDAGLYDLTKPGERATLASDRDVVLAAAMLHNANQESPRSEQAVRTLVWASELRLTQPGEVAEVMAMPRETITGLIVRLAWPEWKGDVSDQKRLDVAESIRMWLVFHDYVNWAGWSGDVRDMTTHEFLELIMARRQAGEIPDPRGG